MINGRLTTELPFKLFHSQFFKNFEFKIKLAIDWFFKHLSFLHSEMVISVGAEGFVENCGTDFSFRASLTILSIKSVFIVDIITRFLSVCTVIKKIYVKFIMILMLINLCLMSESGKT